MSDHTEPTHYRAPELTHVAARMFTRARQELRDGSLDAAELTLVGVLALAPDNVEVLRLAGAVARDLGDMERAVNYFRRAAAVSPMDAELRVDLGIVLFRSSHQEEALAHFQAACALGPDLVSAWYNLGQALQLQTKMGESITALQRALDLDPCHVKAQMALVRAFTSVGRVKEAADELRRVLRQDPTCSDAWFALADLKTIALTSEDQAQIASCIANPVIADNDRIRLEFVLAHALEDQSDYAAAWGALERANADQRRRVEWDAPHEHQRVCAAGENFRRVTTYAAVRELGEGIVFLASLPRSGSTLVEQMLAAHPQVVGANEITDLPRVVGAESERRGSAYPSWVADATPADWERLGRAYLTRTAHLRSGSDKVMTDKNLLNWFMLGAALSMLPSARAIVIQRDPVETCLGCYRQWFDRAAPYTYDLDDLTTVYADFIHLTRFWGDKFNTRVFYLRYEDLVANTESTLRTLLAFCGLRFDARCIGFYKASRVVMSIPSAAQVRQPINSNTARAQKYGNRLRKLRSLLKTKMLTSIDCN